MYTAKDLKEKLANIPDDTPVVFQGNVQGEYDDPDDGDEFVLDCAVTDMEA